MKKLLFGLGLLLATDATGQTNTRMQPQPIRTFAQNPAGVYVGDVSGEVRGLDNGHFYFGRWRLVVTEVQCNDCMPYQYQFLISDFDGHAYGQTPGPNDIESGIGGGIVNPDSGVIDFSMFVANCSSINPGHVYAPGTSLLFSGNYDGGSDSPQPGNRLEVRDGEIRGRIAGRDCYKNLFWTDVVLRRQ